MAELKADEAFVPLAMRDDFQKPLAGREKK